MQSNIIAMESTNILSVKICVICGLLFLGAEAAAFTISGVVAQPHGQPAAEANVWLSQDRSVRTGKTDARGRFRFEDVAAGPVEVVAYQAGYSLGGVMGDLLDDVDISIRLRAAASITLRVSDSLGNRLAGARVKSLVINDAFHVAVEDLVDHGFPSIRSDDDGTLVIAALPEDGHAGVIIAHRDLAEVNLPTLPAGVELPVQMPFGVKLRGRVTSPAGAGVARARVSVFRRGVAGQREFAEVLTGPEGFYTATVPPADYLVVARHPDYAIPDPAPVTIASTDETVVRDVQLAPARAMRGTVVDRSDAPVAGARLAYYARDNLFAAVTTDVAGRFTLTVSPGAGRLQVIPPPGYITLRHPVIAFTLDEGEEEYTLEPIKLAPLPVIRGRVTAPEDMPLDRVIIGTADAAAPVYAIADADGAFELRLEQAPMSGRAEVVAEHALRLLRAQTTVDLRADAPVTLELEPFQPNLEPAPPWSPNDLAHMVGKPAPELEVAEWLNLPSDAAPPKLADLRGKVVVLTLWGGFDATDAARERLQLLNQLHTLYAGVDDVLFLGVHDSGKDTSEIRRYVQEYGITYPVGRDKDPFLTFDAYNTNFIPQTVVIDKTGVLRHYFVDGRLPELIKHLRRE